jgi:hypothetical protein
MTFDLRDKTYFGILYRPDNYISLEVAKQSLEITQYWTGTFVKDYTVSDDLDSILEEASRQNFKYCLIQEAGNLIFDHQFYKILSKSLLGDNWFAFAHIIAKESTGIHPQTIFINVDNWVKIGKPKYQEHRPSEDIELIVPTRCTKNIHDDYTPLWIVTSNQRKKISEYQPGWGWINAALEYKLAVKNFSFEMRKYKLFLYPNKKNLWYDMQSMLLHLTCNERNKVFFDNTEGIKGFEPVKNIDHFYLVASGLKPNVIVESCSFNSNTRITYIDYSGNALEFKKWLHQNWDGRDYVSIVKRYVTEIPVLYESVKWDDIEDHWTKTLDFFGGEDNFSSHWQKFNQIKIDYMLVDIAGFLRKYLLDKIDSTKTNAIWWSHAFNTFNSLMLKGQEGSVICYDSWMDELFQTDPNIITLSCYDNKQNLLPSLPLKDYFNGSI